MATIRKLLIVKVGDTLPELAARTGDFEDWFIAGLGLDDSHLMVFDPRTGADFPPYEQLAGVLVTGFARNGHRAPALERARCPLAARRGGARHPYPGDLLRPPIAGARLRR